MLTSPLRKSPGFRISAHPLLRSCQKNKTVRLAVISKVSLLLILAAVLASAQKVQLTWIGQSCFYFQTENGPTVVADPPSASVGYALPTTPADVVTISHNHTDHNNSSGVAGNFTLVDGRPVTERTQATASGIEFTLVPGFHDNTNGSTRGPNTIVRWTQAGIRFVHFGDFGQDAPTAAQLADLQNIDVLMVPAGGFFTIDATQTAALIQQLNPRVAILMHYRTAIGGPAQLATLPAVTGPFPQIKYKPATVTLTSAALPATTEVWLMEPVTGAVVVNAAGFTAGAPVSPVSPAAVFGSFTGSATATYSSFPLGSQLGGTEVFIGNSAVPLFYVSPTQVNFQVPGGLAPGQNVLEVHVGGQQVARGTITTLAHSPGLFAVTDQAGAIGHGKRGGFITIYGAGQGTVMPAVADGAAAMASPLSLSTDQPSVFINGRSATVSFTGLAPGLVGVWQINAQIPQDLATGADQELIVLFETNVISNALKLTVE
jgi:uncharacterized protein (TIGR03437 family)